MSQSDDEERSMFKAWAAGCGRGDGNNWIRCPFCKDPHLDKDYKGYEDHKPIGCRDCDCRHLIGQIGDGENYWVFDELQLIHDLADNLSDYTDLNVGDLVVPETDVVYDTLSGENVHIIGWFCGYYFLENPDDPEFLEWMKKMLPWVLIDVEEVLEEYSDEVDENSEVHGLLKEAYSKIEQDAGKSEGHL